MLGSSFFFPRDWTWLVEAFFCDCIPPLKVHRIHIPLCIRFMPQGMTTIFMYNHRACNLTCAIPARKKDASASLGAWKRERVFFSSHGNGGGARVTSTHCTTSREGPTADFSAPPPSGDFTLWDGSALGPHVLRPPQRPGSRGSCSLGSISLPSASKLLRAYGMVPSWLPCFFFLMGPGRRAAVTNG